MFQLRPIAPTGILNKMLHPWEEAYRKKSFCITTSEPSLLIKNTIDSFKGGDYVLDIGCGNGRNSIFLSQKNIQVDSFDVVDLGWYQALTPEIKRNIHFTQLPIEDWEPTAAKYRAVILARVIQYLPFSEIARLFDKISGSLQKSGMLLVSYSTQGGIHDRKEIEVSKFSHPIEEIERMLKRQFRDVTISKGSTTSQHVNYEGSLISYDIVAIK